MKNAFIALACIALGAMPTFAGSRVRPDNFASDFQTIPVMGNTPGAGGARFQTFVALLNPTAAAFPVAVTLYDANGNAHTASIPLAAGELKTYQNFLDSVFGVTGGGAVVFRSPDPANRFIVDAEVWTTGNRYGTTIPTLEFAGSNSRSFAAGVTVDASSRTNVGCFNQSEQPNRIRVTVHDATGALTLATFDLELAGNAWGQTPVLSVVSDGYVQFDPQEAAVCYAVVVNNGTNDGRFISATEYEP